MLRLQNVSRSFPGAVSVLRNIQLDVRRGECLALLGPSGSGKTTLLRLIAGLDEPDAGTIQIDGRMVQRVPPWERGVAMTFQRPALLPNKSVRSQLPSGVDARQTLALLELSELLDRLPHQLSGGEKQRVALGRAWLRHAPLLLLDEPLSHVDVPLKRKIWRDLGLLRLVNPATMVYVTHDPWEAAAVGDRIAVLLQGKIAQVDTLGILQTSPRHPFIAELFADVDEASSAKK